MSQITGTRSTSTLGAPTAKKKSTRPPPWSASSCKPLNPQDSLESMHHTLCQSNQSGATKPAARSIHATYSMRTISESLSDTVSSRPLLPGALCTNCCFCVLSSHCQPLCKSSHTRPRLLHGWPAETCIPVVQLCNFGAYAFIISF